MWDLVYSNVAAAGPKHGRNRKRGKMKNYNEIIVAVCESVIEAIWKSLLIVVVSVLTAVYASTLVGSNFGWIAGVLICFFLLYVATK